jgi:hypothetical protein
MASAGNFREKLLPQPVKAGVGWLLELHYGKAAFGFDFCHSQSSLVWLPAFAQSQSC